MALLQPGMPRHLSYIDVHTGRPVVDYTFKVLRYTWKKTQLAWPLGPVSMRPDGRCRTHNAGGTLAG